MRDLLPAHTLRVVADRESKQTAPEPSPQRPRGNRPIALHTVCGWDEKEWDYAMQLPWWYFWAWLSARCQWPRLEQMPLEIRGHCEWMGVCVPTHASLASLAPCPKCLRPNGSSGFLLFIASRPHTCTQAPMHRSWTPTWPEHAVHAQSGGQWQK